MSLEVSKVKDINKDEKIKDIQNYLNYKYSKERGFSISCNGLYTEELATALIYALQRLEGFPVSICNDFNGTLLEGIKNNLPILTPGEKSDFVALLQYYLYCVGYKDIEFTGVYDKATESAVSNFSFSNKLGNTTIVIPRFWESLINNLLYLN